MLDLVEGDHVFFRNGYIGRVCDISTHSKIIDLELVILNGFKDVLWYERVCPRLDLDGKQYTDRPSEWDIESRAIYKSGFWNSKWTSKPIEKWRS